MLHKTRPIFSTQFHPEAKGGPMDSSFLFDRYLQSVKMYKDSQKVYKDNRPSGLLVELLGKERVGVYVPDSVPSSRMRFDTDLPSCSEPTPLKDAYAAA